MQNKSVTLSKEQAGVKKKVDPAEPSHDIRIYMSRLHRERKFIDPEELRMSNLATLRKLLRKLLSTLILWTFFAVWYYSKVLRGFFHLW